MDLNEFQAKELFRKYGIPIPQGNVAHSTEEAVQAASANPRVVIKAQVLTGGRGKAGGIKVANTIREVEDGAGEILSMSIKGFKVNKVLVEEQLDIKKELYLCVVLDRENEGYKLIFSETGGIDIEELARREPENIKTTNIEPFPGLVPFQLREILHSLGEETKKYAREIYQIMNRLYTLFIETDAKLAEINPLVVTGEGKCVACDAKVSIDDNALFRHSELLSCRLPEDEIPLEREAREKGLSYIKMEGNIGCLVNGAGLAMATMDVLKHYGGSPANFLDIGGGAKAKQVKDALEIINKDTGVNTIFINIFGGIVRCDLVAEGILKAKKELNIKKKLVIRLIGTNDQKAYEMLDREGVRVFTGMADAAVKAVELAKEI